MSSSLSILTSIIDATPGATSSAHVQIHNAGSAESIFSVQVVGLGDFATPTITVPVPASATVECVVPVPIPLDIATGQHAAAIQATTNESGARPILAPFTISIESIENVSIVADPTPIRGRRGTKFVVGVGNGEATPVAFTLTAEATEVSVKFKTSSFRLLPGERASTKAKVRGPRHISGEPIQHNLVIAAHGKAATTTITTPFIQRPVFAHKFRAIVAAFAVIALWLAAIGGVLLWVSSRSDDAQDAAAVEAQDAALVQLIDANGVPMENGPYSVLADGTIVDSEGTPVEGFSVDENGNVIDAAGNPVNGVFVDPDSNELVDAEGTPIGLPTDDAAGTSGADGGTAGGDGGSGSGSGGDVAQGSEVDGTDAGGPVSGITAPTSTLLRGSVDAGGADLSDVSITLAPLDLGASPSPDATVIGGDGGNATPPQTSAGKIWSARFALIDVGLNPVRQTEPVAPLEATPDVDGVWLISDVALRKTYELSFAKPGFDTQAFVISPPDDGSPVELDVVLEPASGVISGRVVDNGRALGGVEISLSDGTLTFVTTSATDGDVGSFNFDSVSTPGVFTLVAARNGYGTSVLQLPMDPGQERRDVVVEMDAGVGTISGSVIDENGVPLGGVPVTATSGEITRTTTTLTDGNRGFYSIPQLDVPGTYTVTVDTTGYLPQTRRVPMSGSVGGVSFTLVSTTSTLSGVVSSAGGGGIVGAGITLSNADLQFEVSSAIDPQAGAFAVENLPDGNYTVTFEHFEHQTVTEFITIAPGVDPPALNVTMPVRDLTVDAGSGSLVIEVIDPAAENTEDRELEGADIKLVETRTGITRYEILDAPSFTVEFPDVAVGTYTILVSVDRYNDSAPRQVSIGQSQERRTIEMLAFGAATGSMIDAVTGEIVTGYTVKFFEQDADGGAEREIGLAEVNVASSSEGVWATTPRSLPAGRYRVEVSGANGYAEPTTQILTPGLDQMEILIQPSANEATVIPTLVAQRYPDILGQVYEPRLVAGEQTEFDPFTDTDLAVGMRCDGGDLVDVPTWVDFPADAPAASGAFRISRQAVDANDLIGQCELEFSAPGYVTQTVTLANVIVNRNNVLSDRVVNVAVVKPVDTFGGRVFWVDDRNGNELPLGGVDIRTNAVTSFAEKDTGAVPPGQIPTVVPTDLSTSSAADGAWTLDGQIFEDARYTFTTPNFGPGTLDVVIDETRTRTVTAVAGMNLTEVSKTNYDVELEPPNNGAVIGEVTILSNDTKDYGDVGISGTDPFGNTASDAVTDPAKCTTTDSGLCIVRTNGDFVIENASAGTWTTDFTAPPNHIIFGAANPTVTPQVDSESGLVGPAQRRSGFDTTIVELGTLEVTLIDSSTNQPITSDATVSLTGAGNPALGGTGLTDPNGDYSIDGILVHPSDPENTPTVYNLEVAARGYDSSGASVTADAGSTGSFTPTSNAKQIQLSVRAGNKPQLTVRLDPYGSIVAQALGDVGTATDEQLLPGTNELEVDWAYVRDLNGNTVSASELAAINADVLVRPGPGAGEFEIQGPPGFYTIDVSHPRFQPDPFAVKPSSYCALNPLLTNCTNGSIPGAAYRLQNGVPNPIGTFRAAVRTSEIELEVVERLDTGGAVSGASYTLTPISPLTVAAIPGTTDGNGFAGTVDPADPSRIRIAGVTPGTWQLEIRKYVDPLAIPLVDNAYPVITTFTVGPSSATATAVTTVRAPLPPLGGSITGQARAQNSEDQPVPLDPLTISRAFLPTLAVGGEFEGPKVDVDGTLVDNAFPGEPGIPVDGDTATTPGATGDVQLFTISGLATGRHELIFEEPTGYTFSNAPDATVDVDVNSTTTATQIPDPADPSVAYVYTVEDITDVTTRVVPADLRERFPQLEVKLVRSDLFTVDGCAATVDPKYIGAFADTNSDGIPDPDSDGGFDVSWSLIPPALDAYSLCVSDDLHSYSPTQVTIPVIPRDSGGVSSLDLTSIYGTIQPTADVARVTGALTRKLGDALPVPIVTADGADLTISAGNLVTPIVLENVASPFIVDLDAPTGVVDIDLTAPGYQDSATIKRSFAPGRIHVQDIEISNLVTFEVTITNNPLPTGLSVTIVEDGDSSNSTLMTPLTAGVFTADVEAGPSYVFEVSADGLPDTYGSAPVLAGGTEPLLTVDIEIPRILTITYSNAPTGATITPYLGSTPQSGTALTGKNTSGSSGTLTFNSTVDAFPADGVISVLASGTGRRTISVPSTALTGFRPSATVAFLDLLDVSGNIEDPGGSKEGGVIVSATATGLTGQTTGPTGNSGNYSFTTGLSNNADGSDAVWTITADEVGVGTASATVTVSGTSVTVDNGVDAAVTTTGAESIDLDFDLVPNLVPINFTITDSRSPFPGIENLVITMPGATNSPQTTNSSGQLDTPLLLPENAGDLSFAIGGAGASDYSDAVNLTGNASAITAAGDRAGETIVRSLAINTTTLTIQAVADVGPNPVGALVTLIDQASTNTVGTTNTVADGFATFTVDVDSPTFTYTVTESDYTYATTSDDPSERVVDNVQLRAGTTETVNLIVNKVSVVFTVLDGSNSNAALPGATITYPSTGTALTGTTASNVKTYTGVPVNIAGSAGTDISSSLAELATYDDKSNDITTADLRTAYSGSGSFPVSVIMTLT